MLKLLIPPRCVVCGEIAAGLCITCATSLPPAPERTPPAGISTASALFAHAGTGKLPVLALKYHNHRDAVGLLGAAMAALVMQLEVCPDAVTWAPTTPARRRRRGFDQAELLARSVGFALGVDCLGLLLRQGNSSQVGQRRAERLSGPRFTSRQYSPSQVLIVDDVRTTGATLLAAAVALRSAGAQRIDAVTVSVRP